MVTCKKCGAHVVGDAVYCVKCGQRLKPTLPPANAIYCAKCGQALPHAEGYEHRIAADASSAELAIPQNYAAPMSYVFGWVSGLVLLFMDKRPVVRFHAAQSVIVFGVLNIAGFIAGRLSRTAFLDSPQEMMTYIAFGSFALICFTALILWIILMVKAFELKPIRIPIAAQIADVIAGKNRK
jgi:uncharacterized membrane protein